MADQEQVERLAEALPCVGNIGLYVVYRQCGRKTKTTYDGRPLCGQHKPGREEAIMKDLKLRRNGASANIDFYRANRDDLYVEVLIDAFERVPGGRAYLRARKVPKYNITIKRHNGKRWTDVQFIYEPKTKPKGIHLPDITLTRLVREKLEATS